MGDEVNPRLRDGGGTGGQRCTDRAARHLLGLHVLGRLTPAERARALRHVDQCPPCAAETAALRGITYALDLLSPSDVAEIVATRKIPAVRSEGPPEWHPGSVPGDPRQ
jgi:anti-sigma factor RsiW